MERLKFHERKRAEQPRPGLLFAEAAIRISRPVRSPASAREKPLSAFVIDPRQAELFEVVLTLRATSRFARRLNGGQQQCDQDADDGDHHEKFHESETAGVRLLRRTDSLRSAQSCNAHNPTLHLVLKHFKSLAGRRLARIRIQLFSIVEALFTAGNTRSRHFFSLMRSVLITGGVPDCRLLLALQGLANPRDAAPPGVVMIGNKKTLPPAANRKEGGSTLQHLKLTCDDALPTPSPPWPQVQRSRVQATRRKSPGGDRTARLRCQPGCFPDSQRRSCRTTLAPW